MKNQRRKSPTQNKLSLAVIELLTAHPDGIPLSGPLGASTIVGSAAFNLFIISACCIYGVTLKPKKIAQLTVFKITAFFSVFAYIFFCQF